MNQPINEWTDRVAKLFNHGDMSFHLAKLLEECGELAQAVNKRQGLRNVCEEMADVVLSALLIAKAYSSDYKGMPVSVSSGGKLDLAMVIELKLKALESNPSYRNFEPPRRKTDLRD